MYLLLLTAHSALRWVVLVVAIWAVLGSFEGIRRHLAWTRRSRVRGMVLAAVVDLQLLLGLALWVGLSPHAITSSGRNGYWTFLHPLAGLTVVALVHVGSALSKRLLDDSARWRTSARFYGAALAVAVLAIPWPFLPWGRSLLPF